MGQVMKIGLSDEQQMLRRASRQLAEKDGGPTEIRHLADGIVRFDSASWVPAAELAWPAMLIPEEFGGAGEAGGITNAAIIGEELGRALHPAPFTEINVVADAVARFGSDDLRARVLPGISDGSLIATWAIADDGESWDGGGRLIVAAPTGTGWVISGRKVAVRDAAVADLILVAAAGPNGPIEALISASAPGVRVAPTDGLDLTRRLDTVFLDRVPVRPSDVLTRQQDTDPLERQLYLAAALTCADTVGAATRLFEGTVEYARQRFAFGRPIGSFQAVKHQLADGYTWLEAAQAATWQAADALQSSAPDTPETVSVAKAFVGEHCSRIAQMCMQVYGGIAMTWEHDAHLFLRRIRTDDALYGAASWHRDRLCTIVGMGRGR